MAISDHGISTRAISAPADPAPVVVTNVTGNSRAIGSTPSVESIILVIASPEAGNVVEQGNIAETRVEITLTITAGSTDAQGNAATTRTEYTLTPAASSTTDTGNIPTATSFVFGGAVGTVDRGNTPVVKTIVTASPQSANDDAYGIQPTAKVVVINAASPLTGQSSTIPIQQGIFLSEGGFWVRETAVESTWSNLAEPTDGWTEVTAVASSWS